MLERCSLTLELIFLSWYSVLASGSCKKLERWDRVRAIRDAPALIWPPCNTPAWMAAHTRFDVNNWSKRIKLILEHCNSKFHVDFNKSKHVGVFPEQVVHWTWARKQLKHFKTSARIRALVLFSYTSAWLNELGNNAYITCVDVDATIIKKAKTNAKLAQRSRTHWVNSDVFKFLKACVNKNLKFNIIIADPPAVGWINTKRCNLVPKLAELITLIDEVCAARASAVCLNLYSDKYNNVVVHELVKRKVSNIKTLDSGNVIVREIANEKVGARIPSSRFVRWTK
ncbi:SAM-dependent methyltransferase [Candidatus Hodgkinia cicadicola]|nr:SAM-dependent methyltransferase [Candidatus Hodgkinia cicadicola]